MQNGYWVMGTCRCLWVDTRQSFSLCISRDCVRRVYGSYVKGQVRIRVQRPREVLLLRDTEEHHQMLGGAKQGVLHHYAQSTWGALNAEKSSLNEALLPLDRLRHIDRPKMNTHAILMNKKKMRWRNNQEKCRTGSMQDQRWVSNLI